MAEQPIINLETGKVDVSEIKPEPQKPSKIERVKTGIEGLDREIQGGFIKTSYD